MGIENFISFVLTALIFIMTPGIDTVFVLNKSMGQGKASGAYAAFGVNAGVLIHTLFAALGLSVIVANSATAFTTVKFAGAAYLMYLGVMKLKNNKNMFTTGIVDKGKTNAKANCISGFLTNAMNPKVALFFLAFFPQFINPEQMKNPVPFLVLGLSYALIGTLWFLILSFFAGMFSEKIKGNEKAGPWLNRFSGVVFILMGLKIAFSNN